MFFCDTVLLNETYCHFHPCERIFFFFLLSLSQCNLCSLESFKVLEFQSIIIYSSCSVQVFFLHLFMEVLSNFVPSVKASFLVIRKSLFDSRKVREDSITVRELTFFYYYFLFFFFPSIQEKNKIHVDILDI